MEARPAPSLLRPVVRRAFRTGRFYLVYGSGISCVLAVVLALSGGDAFATSFPLLLPIFGVVGSLGGLIVFSNDRIKGVLEYLLAYGVTPQQVFFSILVAALTLQAVVVGAGLTAGVVVYLANGRTLTANLALDFGLYSVPMSIASVIFAATVGTYWTTLSSPRSGMNSPIGLIPMIGILPSVATLFGITALAASGLAAQNDIYLVGGTVEAVIVVVVAVLLGGMNRFLRRERLLSPA